MSLTRLLSHAIVVGAILLLALTSPTQAAEPTVWRVAVVVYGSLDADCQGTTQQSITTPAMRARADAEIAAFTSKVADWSSGAAAVDVTVIERPVLSSLSPAGFYCWPDVADVADYPVGYDSTIILWPAPPVDATFGPPKAGRAHTYVLPSGTHATAIIGDDSGWFEASLSQVMVHEWLNGALALHRSLWPNVPSLYVPSDYGFMVGDPDWYAHIMGSILTPARWAAAGTPTHPGDGIAVEPRVEPCAPNGIVDRNTHKCVPLDPVGSGNEPPVMPLIPPSLVLLPDTAVGS